MRAGTKTLRLGRPARSSFKEIMARLIRDAETRLIRRALARAGGNRTEAARILSISRRALLYKLNEYNLRRP